ncbi:hypothetical protein KGD83_00305 [Nocardiopsis akebiae]|uniref:Uncharacterized protein n=1 Tax=Nocardiopsis akebiae TaxID=2831968 RepID=A0ABX8C3X7_9ACTN|nr:hypothetical protein [Nocardiopsis akebiae]QUX29094.1 hypothetical protein KGD83_00305 [Nocardiopsis akebiae]
MARNPKELPLPAGAALCTITLVWLVGDIAVGLSQHQGWEGVGAATWSGGILNAVALPFIIGEYRRRHAEEHGHRAASDRMDVRG